MYCNYQTILDEASNLLKNYNIKNPRLDSELLLSNSLNISRENLLLNLNKKINSYECKTFKSLLKKRTKKMPIAYILGYKDFWKSKFYINNSVLIPRPETELVVEEALNYLPKNKSKNVLDIGTGSGCLAISLAKEYKNSMITATDISKTALDVAKKNSKKFIYSKLKDQTVVEVILTMMNLICFT